MHPALCTLRIFTIWKCMKLLQNKTNRLILSLFWTTVQHFNSINYHSLLFIYNIFMHLLWIPFLVAHLQYLHWTPGVLSHYFNGFCAFLTLIKFMNLKVFHLLVTEWRLFSRCFAGLGCVRRLWWQMKGKQTGNVLVTTRSSLSCRSTEVQTVHIEGKHRNKCSA